MGFAIPVSDDASVFANGSFQTESWMIDEATTNTPARAKTTNATGRHRGDGSSPVGNSRSRRISIAIGIGQTAPPRNAAAFPTQAGPWPPTNA